MLPAADDNEKLFNASPCGRYCSSVPLSSSDISWGLNFLFGGNVTFNARYIGQSVRPVQEVAE